MYFESTDTSLDGSLHLLGCHRCRDDSVVAGGAQRDNGAAPHVALIGSSSLPPWRSLGRWLFQQRNVFHVMTAEQENLVERVERAESPLHPTQQSFLESKESKTKQQETPTPVEDSTQAKKGKRRRKQ